VSSTIEKAQAVITERLGEIETESKQLQRALASLRGRPAARTRRSPSRSASVRSRAPRGERRRQVLDHLKHNAGATPVEIGKAIDASPNQVHGIVRKLRDEKLLRKSGKGYKLREPAPATDG
jgi:hypothetical protein